MEKQKNWVETWGMSHVSLSFMSFYSRKRTFRLILDSAISGENIRIRLCNRHSNKTVTVGKACAAVCDKEGRISDMPSLRYITFGGKDGITIEKGETAVSDAVCFKIPADTYICVDIFIKKGKLKSGNLSNNAAFISARGGKAGETVIKRRKRIKDYVFGYAGSVLGVSLNNPIPLFQAVELLNADNASSVVCFGDSISQQGFWTKIFEEKLRSLYPGRYSVITKAIMGNRLLRDTGKKFPLRGFMGVKGLDRVNDDIFAFEGISHVVLWIGHNDFLQPGTIVASKSEFAAAEEIAAGFEKLAAMIKASGACLIGMNYVPLGLSPDATPAKAEIRAELNERFCDFGIFDYKFDAYSAFVSPDNEDCPNIAYVGKDRIHPNAEGGRVLAEVIDYGIFNS
ncbi:MAG: GDSL-type esterase/lipase family protein [Oscillospiraceae bacterium]|nr:GDSL-type esterase/lipase family protein [Oscillospiraceae bacterium]